MVTTVVPWKRVRSIRCMKLSVSPSMLAMMADGRLMIRSEFHNDRK